MRRLLMTTALAALVLTMPLPGVEARERPADITLAGASSAEGIAAGAGSTFFAGDLFRGDIYRGDLTSGAVSLFIDAPTGRMALGMKVDLPRHLLFVAGGFTGDAYVYDERTGANVATLHLASPASAPIINDVVVTGDTAWFTDSAHAVLYRVPVGANGAIGTPSTLALSGPAAHLTGTFNVNGIAATGDGRTLIVSHTADATLYTVNSVTGASAPIAGASVPNVDGILFEAGRLWAVQNFSNQVTVFRLSADLTTATVQSVITSPLFEVPTAAARHGSSLAIVNAKFDTGFPPTASTYDVVVVDAR